MQQNVFSPKKKSIIAWCMYDWANSAFATTILAGFFPVFFKNFWNAGVDTSVSTAHLGFATTIGGLCVALLSPILGSFADAGRAKKSFLFFFVMLGAGTTAALSIIPYGYWISALVVFVLADLCFSYGNLFYDSLLPDVASPKRMDFVSSLGYALGYVGGGTLFLVNILMVVHPIWFGLTGKSAAIRMSFITVGVWWFVFAIPLFIFVREPHRATRVSLLRIVPEGFKRLKATGKSILGNTPLLLFLAAYWLYIDGVYTFIRMAVDFGLSIGLSSTSLMTSLLIVQFVAFPAALGFGKLANTIGTAKAILVGIGIYTLVCITGPVFLHTQTAFMLFAALVGMVQGGIQALSRSYFGKIIPQDESAEYFGFYNLVGKCSVIAGPFVVGVCALVSRHAGASSDTAARLGMSSIVIFFLLGGFLFIVAEKARKRKAGA